MPTLEAPKKDIPKAPPAPTVDMVRAPKACMRSLAGLPWTEALRAGLEGRDGCSVDAVQLGYTTQQPEHPQWKPQVDEKGNVKLFLQLGYAWLREHQGRAFLYLQNW